MSRRHSSSCACLLAAGLLAACGNGDGDSPAKTLRAFFDAAAAGDGAKACSLLTTEAQRQFVRGFSCERGFKLLGPALGRRVKDAKITASTKGDRATAKVSVDGAPRGSFVLRKSGGRWRIASGQNVGGGPSAATSTSGGPSSERVESVRQCLRASFPLVTRFGSSIVGGVRHAVLSFRVGGTPFAARVNLYASEADARAGLPALERLYRSSRTVKRKGSSVLVYKEEVTADAQRKIEACA